MMWKDRVFSQVAIWGTFHYASNIYAELFYWLVPKFATDIYCEQGKQCKA